MKAYFPENYRQHEKRMGFFRLFYKIVVILLFSLSGLYLHTFDFAHTLDLKVFSIFQLSQKDRTIPRTVTIVRMVENPKTFYSDSPWPTSEKITKGISAIANSNPKAFFIDFPLREEEFSEKERDQIVASLRKSKSALATDVIFTTETNKLSKELKFSSDESFQKAAKPYTNAAEQSVASDFSFGTAPDNIDKWFIDTFTSLTGIQTKPESGTKMINFYGPPGSIDNLTLTDLVSMDELDVRNRLSGRIVFLGYQTHPWRTSERRGDVMTAVYDRAMADTEIRATIAANLIDGSAIRAPTNILSRIALFLFLIVLFAIATFSRGALTVKLLISFLLFITWGEYLAITSLYYWISGLTVLYLCSLVALFFNLCLDSKPADDSSIFDFGKCKF